MSQVLRDVREVLQVGLRYDSFWTQAGKRRLAGLEPGLGGKRIAN